MTSFAAILRLLPPAIDKLSLFLNLGKNRQLLCTLQKENSGLLLG